MIFFVFLHAISRWLIQKRAIEKFNSGCLWWSTLANVRIGIINIELDIWKGVPIHFLEKLTYQYFVKYKPKWLIVNWEYRAVKFL